MLALPTNTADWLGRLCPLKARSRFVAAHSFHFKDHLSPNFSGQWFRYFKAIRQASSVLVPVMVAMFCSLVYTRVICLTFVIYLLSHECIQAFAGRATPNSQTSNFKFRLSCLVAWIPANDQQEHDLNGAFTNAAAVMLVILFSVLEVFTHPCFWLLFRLSEVWQEWL